MTFRLIDNWKHSWKFASVQISLGGIALFPILEFADQTWKLVPAEIKEQIPHSPIITQVILGLILISRVVKLKERTKDETTG